MRNHAYLEMITSGLGGREINVGTHNQPDIVTQCGFRENNINNIINSVRT